MLRTIGQWAPTWIPVIAAIALVLVWGSKPGILLAIVLAVLLIATIMSAVHHAEVLAHKVG